MQSIEFRVRFDQTRTGISFPSIELSREAADAAGRNLELVTDSYSRGLVSIIELLDAQNAARVAEQAAQNSVYDFFIDLMELQRAAGNFGFLKSERERDELFERLDSFMVEELLHRHGTRGER